MIDLFNLIIFFTILAVSLLLPTKLDRHFNHREPKRRLWMRAYPGQRFSKASEALNWICDAFAIDDSHRFSLRPSDRLRSYYNAFSDKPPYCDQFEYAVLADLLEEAGHDCSILNRQELTVRELVVLHAGEPDSYTAL